MVETLGCRYWMHSALKFGSNSLWFVEAFYLKYSNNFIMLAATFIEWIAVSKSDGKALRSS